MGIYLNDPGVRERRSKVEGDIVGWGGSENFSSKEGPHNSKYWYRLAAVGLRRRRDSVLALRRGFQETPRGGAESSSPDNTFKDIVEQYFLWIFFSIF